MVASIEDNLVSHRSKVMDVGPLFVALADPTRRRVFELVAQHEGASITEIAAELPVTRGAVSQHLRVLVDSNLLVVEVQGRRRVHRIRPEGLEALSAYAVVQRSAGRADDPLAAQLSKWEAEAPHIDHGVLALLMYLAQIGQDIVASSEEVAAEVGLTFSDVAVLGALRRLGPPYESTPSRLAETFWITLPGMTRRLSRLENRGLLRRRDDPDDGRSTFLRLTPTGLDLLRDLVANHQPPEYYALLGLEPDERVHLARTLRRLVSDVDAHQGRSRPRYLVRAQKASEDNRRHEGSHGTVG